MNLEPIEILYPINGGKLTLPVGGDGLIASKVFYNLKGAELHWELNNAFVGSTNKIHEMQIAPQQGQNTLCLTTNDGVTQCVRFQVAL